MYNKNNSLASLLSSRICHDLANPLGAISNGLELMELSGASRTPEFELTASSVQNAKAKLNFFRVAFGLSSGREMSHAEIAKTLSDMYRNSRHQVNWEITTATSRQLTKLLFLLIQCLETATPRGARISVHQDETNFLVSAQADKVNCAGKNWTHLTGGPQNAQLSATEIQFELARACLEEMDINMKLNATDEQAVITL